MNTNCAKFGQATVVYDEGIIDYIWRNYFGRETLFTNKTNIIVLFNENNNTYELNKLPIERYLINEAYSIHKIPSYIKINKLALYKKKITEDKKTFSELFTSNYGEIKCIYSAYNCIFYFYDRQYLYNERIIFALFKSKQATDSCQFTFSYDNSKLTEIQVYNLIRMILTSL